MNEHLMEVIDEGSGLRPYEAKCLNCGLHLYVFDGLFDGHPTFSRYDGEFISSCTHSPAGECSGWPPMPKCQHTEEYEAYKIIEK